MHTFGSFRHGSRSHMASLMGERLREFHQRKAWGSTMMPPGVVGMAMVFVVLPQGRPRSCERIALDTYLCSPPRSILLPSPHTGLRTFEGRSSSTSLWAKRRAGRWVTLLSLG